MRMRQGLGRLGLGQLDQLLRGEKTDPSALQQTNLNIHPLGVGLIIVLLAVAYGLCMSSFALARGLEAGDSHSIQQAIMQTIASMTKMPLLFLLTLCVTFPSLYVFSALAGSRMRIDEVFRLLIAALAVNLAVLASLGPIVAFFSVSTPNYYFVLLLNVVCCSVAGSLGLFFLLQTLHRMIDPNEKESTATSSMLHDHDSFGMRESTVPSTEDSRPGPLKRTSMHVLGAHVRKVFWIWVVVFGMVGAQMSWVLRPFIGSPDKPFTWLRTRDSNVFEAVMGALRGLFG